MIVILRGVKTSRKIWLMKYSFPLIVGCIYITKETIVNSLENNICNFFRKDKPCWVSPRLWISNSFCTI